MQVIGHFNSTVDAYGTRQPYQLSPIRRRYVVFMFDIQVNSQPLDQFKYKKKLFPLDNHRKLMQESCLTLHVILEYNKEDVIGQ